MPPDESMENNTCRVNEPTQMHTTNAAATHEQGQMELDLLKLRVHKAEKIAEQAQERLRFQGNILVAWRRKLGDQATLIKRLTQEKDRQMRTIATNLLIVEADLRKEQSQILRLVREKDDLITSQEQQIHALVALNRKLAAMGGSQQQRHSNRQRASRSQSCRSVYVPTANQGSLLRLDARSDTINEQTTNEVVKSSVSTSEVAHLDKENVIPPLSTHKINDEICTHDTVICNNSSRSPWDKTARRHVPTLEALDEVTEEMTTDEGEKFGTEENYSSDKEKQVNGKTLTSQTASFNRVMSTHRNVTKPKDVKYKKINRVKSRSLEELRGKLRSWTHPFFVADKFS